MGGGEARKVGFPMKGFYILFFKNGGKITEGFEFKGKDLNLIL